MFREKVGHAVEVYIDDMVVKSGGMLLTLLTSLKYLDGTSCVLMLTNMSLEWGLVSSWGT